MNSSSNDFCWGSIFTKSGGTPICYGEKSHKCVPYCFTLSLPDTHSTQGRDRVGGLSVMSVLPCVGRGKCPSSPLVFSRSRMSGPWADRCVVFAIRPLFLLLYCKLMGYPRGCTPRALSVFKTTAQHPMQHLSLQFLKQIWNALLYCGKIWQAAQRLCLHDHSISQNLGQHNPTGSKML